MKRRSLIQGGMAATAVLGAPALSQAQAKNIFKVSNVHPEGFPTVAAARSMGQKLEQATNGRLSIHAYPSAVLGGEKETLEQAQLGAIQIVIAGVGSVGALVDDLNVFNMPFVFRDTAHMEKVIDGPVGDELLAKITNDPKIGLVGLCFMDAGARSFYDTKRSIRTVADMHGLKFRVPGNPIFVEMVKSMGGNAVTMGYDQVFSALQTGVVDGAENNPPSYIFDNHAQVAKFFSLTEHMIIPDVMVFSRPVWNKLSPDDQALVKKLAREAQQEERVLWKKIEQDAFARMKTMGIEINEILDKTPFREAVKPVWEKYRAKYRELIKQIQDVA